MIDTSDGQSSGRPIASAPPETISLSTEPLFPCHITERQVPCNTSTIPRQYGRRQLVNSAGRNRIHRNAIGTSGTREVIEHNNSTATENVTTTLPTILTPNTTNAHPNNYNTDATPMRFFLVLISVFKRNDLSLLHHHHFHQIHQPITTPNIGFSKALSGFLMMMTQNGKLLYISDNAAEYLGHSMEDLLIHGDSVYDMIDKQDHQAIQTELVRSQSNNSENDFRIFLCRMNVSRNARRQMRFGDQKVSIFN
ncbi:hypothetical protein M8J75_015129 [Diaphorina citri]|nr:hypothetical protein M8J75_015129 [Diaphorina citri]